MPPYTMPTMPLTHFLRYIMEDFKMAMVTPKKGPLKPGMSIHPKYVQRSNHTANIWASHYIVKDLHIATRTWVILSGVNKAFRQGVRNAYEELLRFCQAHNASVDRAELK